MLSQLRRQGKLLPTQEASGLLGLRALGLGFLVFFLGFWGLCLRVEGLFF